MSTHKGRIVCFEFWRGACGLRWTIRGPVGIGFRRIAVGGGVEYRGMKSKV